MIDLDPFPSYTKLEIAIRQLDRAICLLLDENDPICAITLAGAAEEILGKLAERQGEQNALGEFINQCVALGELQGEAWNKKIFADLENFFRNELKHIGQETDIIITKECAYSIINRAASNLLKVTGAYTNQVCRYMWEVNDC